ncbi:hypothetical protein ACT7DN_08560 [Bacillus paranthracis]
MAYILKEHTQTVDFGRNHLKTVLGFVGVNDTEYIAVEGMNANPEKSTRN